MRLLGTKPLRRLAYLGRRSRFDADLDAEFQFHIETRADELERAGMPRPDALRQARREFGSPARVAEETRSAWQFRWLEDLAADLRYAARAFRRNPAFAATAIACLALGIGANTTIFSIAAEVLFSQPSVRDPHSLVRVHIGGNSASPLREYGFLRDAHIFPGLAGENEEMETNWRDGDSTWRLSVVRVTDNFFDVTGIPVAMGRPIQPGDSDRVVVTYGFWQRRLGGAPDVIGRKLLLDGRIYTVSAVLPRDHRTVTGFGFSPDLYAPVTDPKTIVTLYARLEPGTTRPAALARLKAACQELDRVYPDGNHKWANDLEVSAVSGIERIDTEHELMRPVAGFFAVLMVVVGLVLLIACANVASLLLARASSRSHELAVRLSIGAGRGRIVRQLLAESLLLAACGTAAGLAMNVGLTSLLSRIQLPLPVPIQFLIQPDWRLLGYAAAVALGCSLAAGLAPAIKGAGVGISATLEARRASTGPQRLDTPQCAGGRATRGVDRAALRRLPLPAQSPEGVRHESGLRYRTYGLGLHAPGAGIVCRPGQDARAGRCRRRAPAQFARRGDRRHRPRRAAEQQHEERHGGVYRPESPWSARRISHELRRPGLFPGDADSHRERPRVPAGGPQGRAARRHPQPESRGQALRHGRPGRPLRAVWQRRAHPGRAEWRKTASTSRWGKRTRWRITSLTTNPPALWSTCNFWCAPPAGRSR